MADLASTLLQLNKRKTYPEMLAEQASQTTPTNWAGALARALQGGMAGYFEGQDKQRDVSDLDKIHGGNVVGGVPQEPQPPSISQRLVSLLGGSSDVPAQAPQPDMTQPRGIRNNNPLNIESGTFTQGQPGYAGSDGRFARFQQPQQGVDAANRLLDTYQNKYGLNTVAGIVNRWAPPNENNTQGYAGAVAKELGVDPNAPLTPEQRPALIAAMGRVENGRPIQMAENGQLPPNAQPTQGTLQQQPPPSRIQPQIPADVFRQAREITRRDGLAAGMALLAPYVTPKDRYITVEGPNGRLIQRNILNDEEKPSPRQNPYQIQQRADGAIVAVNPNNPQDVQVIKPAGASADLITQKGEEKRAEEKGTVLGKGDAAVPSVLENAKFIGKTIGDIENHPGLSMGTGLTGTIVGRIPGTPAYDFQTAIGQLKGRAFLDAFEALRGGGQISNVEGEKASAAKARMDTAQSEGAFRAALKDYTDVVRSAVNRVIQQSRTTPEQRREIESGLGPQSGGQVRRYNPETGRIE